MAPSFQRPLLKRHCQSCKFQTIFAFSDSGERCQYTKCYGGNFLCWFFFPLNTYMFWLFPFLYPRVNSDVHERCQINNLGKLSACSMDRERSMSWRWWKVPLYCACLCSSGCDPRHPVLQSSRSIKVFPCSGCSPGHEISFCFIAVISVHYWVQLPQE